MNMFRKIFAMILALTLTLPLAIGAQAAETTTNDLIRQMLGYYLYYRNEAQTDFDLLLEEMEEQDPALAETWEDILDFWVDLNQEMEVMDPILPDGLPTDDSLCIVVMGFYLESDGGIRKELEDRLNVALASAEKYPNAYILVTGGGTAAGNNKVTEAGQMAKWLVSHGISQDRIIKEAQASSTIENAQFGSQLLYRDYPQIKSLAVVTSDYHIRRSCLYFNTQAALDAHSANTEAIRVIAAASCPIKGQSATDEDTQVEGMCILTGLKLKDLTKSELSVLEEISVSASGARALYSTGRSRDITEEATFDVLKIGDKGIESVTVTYTENDITKTTVIGPEDLPEGITPKLPGDFNFASAVTTATEAPTELPTEEATEPVLEALPPVMEQGSIPTTAEKEAPITLSTALLMAGGCMLLLAVLIVAKARISKKQK